MVILWALFKNNQKDKRVRKKNEKYSFIGAYVFVANVYELSE